MSEMEKSYDIFREFLCKRNYKLLSPHLWKESNERL